MPQKLIASRDILIMTRIQYYARRVDVIAGYVTVNKTVEAR